MNRLSVWGKGEKNREERFFYPIPKQRACSQANSAMKPSLSERVRKPWKRLIDVHENSTERKKTLEGTCQCKMPRVSNEYGVFRPCSQGGRVNMVLGLP